MEKRAIITVKSFSDIEPNEAIEVVTPGTFIIHEDGFKAIYEESELSGMDGTTTTLNIIVWYLKELVQRVQIWNSKKVKMYYLYIILHMVC